MAQSNNASVNIMGSVHANLILDVTMYQVEFAWGEETELIANTIVKSTAQVMQTEISIYS